MKAKFQNIILTDGNPEELTSFVSGVERVSGMKFSICSRLANVLHGNIFKTILRYFYYFSFPFKFFLRRHRLSVVVTWQQFYGINLALYMRIFHCRKQFRLLVMTFIFNQKPGLLGRLYYKYVKYCISGEYVDKVTVCSSEEVKLYRELFGVDKFIFVPFGCSFPSPDGDVTPGKYIYTTGRSNRDYDFLCESLKDSQHEIVIACNGYDNHSNNDKVEVLSNCFGTQNASMMSGSFCVAIPLKSAGTSAGQLVALQAMSLGKPVVATKGPALSDYIRDGETGLLVNNKKEEWMAAISRLFLDEELYVRLSRTALSEYEQNFSAFCFATRIGRVIRSLI